MNHKEKCEALRKVRLELAIELGIDDCVRKEPCTFEGECTGTCPACQAEEKILLDKLCELKEKNEILILKKSPKPSHNGPIYEKPYSKRTIDDIPTYKPNDNQPKTVWPPLSGQILPLEPPMKPPIESVPLPGLIHIPNTIETTPIKEDHKSLDKTKPEELQMLVFPERPTKMGKVAPKPLVMGEFNETEDLKDGTFEEFIEKINNLFGKKKK